MTAVMADVPRMFELATAFETPAGACGLAWTDAGLTRVRPFEADLASAAARAAQRCAAIVAERDAPPHIAAIIGSLRAFLAGIRTGFKDVTLDLSRTAVFEADLYIALREVGWGETISYAGLAGRIGLEPVAARAVGTAMGRNPWPLIVPCHRVLTSGGKLGGFSAPGGERTKADLLAREGVHLDGGQLALFE